MLQRSFTRTILIAVLGGYLSACGESTSGPDLPEPSVVTTVQVGTPSDSIFRSDTLQLTATVKDQRGEGMPTVEVTWSGSDSLVATVDPTGRVAGLGAGPVRITATAEGKSGSIDLTIVGPGTEGAVPGSALVDDAGGSVQATLPGGGQLTLSIPAGALDSAVQIALDPVIPNLGAQASFRISPAGFRLNEKATLVVKASAGARIRPTTVLVFEQSGLRIPVPSVPDPSEHTVTATLTMLGLPAVVTGEARAQGSLSFDISPALPGGMNSLLDLTVDQMLDDTQSALGQLQALGTLGAADAMLMSMLAVVQSGGNSSPRFSTLQAGWREEVCNARDFAANALRNFGFASDYVGLQRAIAAVVAWGRAVDEMAELLTTVGLPGCLGAPLDTQELIKTELRRMQASIQSDVNGFALTPLPRDSVFLIDRLSPLLDIVRGLLLAGYETAADGLVAVASAQFTRLRFTGYIECREQRPQTVQSRLMRLEAAGGVFASVSPYDVESLESDIELCGMNIRWRLVDPAGAIFSSGTLGGGTNVENSTLFGSGSISGSGALEVDGDLNALRCPAPASANAEQLEVVAGRTGQSLTRIAVLTPSNENSYLAVSTLRISFEEIRTAAGIGSNENAEATLVFRRIGGVCGGHFVNLSHSSLGTLQLASAAVEPLSIESTSVPNATVGFRYTATLAATGGVGNHQWSVLSGQLPGGLSLATNGAITGVPTTAGAFDFTARVVSGNQTAERALRITVVPRITGAYDGTETVLCCFPSFSLEVHSAPARWWLLQGALHALVRGSLSVPTTPSGQTHVPAFVVSPAGGPFESPGVLSGTVGDGQLQFTWEGLCNLMPPFNGRLGTCRLTFTGMLNTSP